MCRGAYFVSLRTDRYVLSHALTTVVRVASAILFLSIAAAGIASREALPEIEWGSLLFQDDFEDIHRQTWWSDALAHVVERDGNHFLSLRVLPDSKGAQIHYQNPWDTWTDYMVRFRLRILGGGASYRFRCSDGCWYSVFIADRLYLAKDSAGGDSISILAAADFSVAWGEWYTFTIVAIGNLYSIYVDDELYISCRDEDNPLLTGWVSFSRKSDAGIAEGVFVDDIEVREVVVEGDGAPSGSPMRDRNGLLESELGFDPQLPQIERWGEPFLLYESFEHGTPLWATHDGWTVGSGLVGNQQNRFLRVTAEESDVEFGEADWADYAVSFYARLQNGAIEVRCRVSEDGYYAAVLAPSSQTVELYRVSSSGESLLGAALVPAFMPGDLGRVTLCGVGPNLAVYLRDRLVLEARDDDPFLSGYAGIATRDVSLYIVFLGIDDLIVAEVSRLGIHTPISEQPDSTADWPMLIKERFDEPSQWLALLGSCMLTSITDTCCVQCSGQVSVPVASGVEDFVLKLDLLLNRGDFGITWRHRGGAGGDQLSIAFHRNLLNFYSCESASWHPEGVSHEKVYKELRPATWHSVELRAVGQTVALYVDGELYFFYRGEDVSGSAGDLFLELSPSTGGPMAVARLSLASPDRAVTSIFTAAETGILHPPGAVLIFDEDFEDDQDAWASLDGWELSRHPDGWGLRRNEREGHFGFGLEGCVLENGILEFRFLSSNGGVTCWIRRTLEQAYIVGIGGSGCEVYRCYDVDTSGERCDTLFKNPLSLDREAWHLFRILAVGGHFEAYVDGVKLTDWTEEEGTYPTLGRVSFEAPTGTLITLDDIRLWSYP